MRRRCRRPTGIPGTIVFALLIATGCSGGGGGGKQARLPLLEVSDVNVTERDSGKADVRIQVRLLKPAKEDVRVGYAAVAVTAKAGADFEAKTGVVEIPAGETSRSITVRVLGDELDEPDETFQVELSAPEHAQLGKESATVVIADDDPPPAIEVSGGTWTERPPSGTARFEVELSEPSGQVVEVDFVTRDGEARSGSDFDLTQGTIRFSPGVVSKEVLVKILHDRRAEADESFFLDLANPRHATIAEGSARSTILDIADAPGGLDKRPVEDGCTFPERPRTGTGIALVPAYPNLWRTNQIQEAIGILQAPGDASRWFVISRPGRVLVFQNDPEVLSSSVALDIRERVSTVSEGGLLGMAFHPAFAANGQVFLFYTGPGDPMTSFLSRFRSVNRGATIDPRSEEVLIRMDNRNVFHKGGDLAFGLDGYLYAGIGDDGNGGHSQDLDVLPGKMLRIDVNSGSLYGIPPDNPLAAVGGRPEIYAWGFRNPWRWSFDRATGDLWLGDVGQVTWEEIDRVVKGGNYGWPYREGSHCYLESRCATPGLIDPVAEWSHAAGGRAAVGGYVYRGNAIPELRGAYVYGDWGWRRVLALVPGAGGYTVRLLAQLEVGSVIYSFAEDAGGEIHVVTGGRRIFRLASASETVDEVLPNRLSDLACVDPDDPRKPADGLIPYDVNVPFWSDGATKERWVAIPRNGTIHIDGGDWDLPVGTTVLKHFRLGGKLVETRLLVRHADGGWAGYTYEWDSSQEDAELLTSGKTKTIGSKTYTFPSRAQCLDCHTDAAGGTLGFETLQMNRSFTYAKTRRTRNQITTFEELGLFAASPGDPDHLPALPRLTDTRTPVEERARAYLHANCSHCHRPESLGRGSADFRFDVVEKAMGICEVWPLTPDPSIPDARLLVPGNSSKSLVLTRLRADVGRRMPPLGSNLEDDEGAELVEDWIESLEGCP